MNKELKLKRAAKLVLGNLDDYHHQCHVASIKLVKAGIGDRVARGWCSGVFGQHSWVVVGNPYRPELIIDPTLWSYRIDVDGIYVGTPETYKHTPHGAGSIWEWGKPVSAGGKAIKLTPKNPLPDEVSMFLELLGDLDEVGWHALLAIAPVEGWPAKEVYEAAYYTKELASLIPIDRLGMLTDLNPVGLYLR